MPAITTNPTTESGFKNAKNVADLVSILEKSEKIANKERIIAQVLFYAYHNQHPTPNRSHTYVEYKLFDERAEKHFRNLTEIKDVTVGGQPLSRNIEDGVKRELFNLENVYLKMSSMPNHQMRLKAIGNVSDVDGLRATLKRLVPEIDRV